MVRCVYALHDPFPPWPPPRPPDSGPRGRRGGDISPQPPRPPFPPDGPARGCAPGAWTRGARVATCPAGLALLPRRTAPPAGPPCLRMRWAQRGRYPIAESRVLAGGQSPGNVLPSRNVILHSRPPVPPSTSVASPCERMAARSAPYEADPPVARGSHKRTRPCRAGTGNAADLESRSVICACPLCLRQFPCDPPGPPGRSAGVLGTIRAIPQDRYFPRGNRPRTRK